MMLRLCFCLVHFIALCDAYGSFGNSFSVAQIIGGVIGFVLFVIFLVVIIKLCRRRRMSQGQIVYNQPGVTCHSSHPQAQPYGAPPVVSGVSGPAGYSGYPPQPSYQAAAPYTGSAACPPQPYPPQPYPPQSYPSQPYPAQPYPSQPYPNQPYGAPAQPYPVYTTQPDNTVPMAHNSEPPPSYESVQKSSNVTPTAPME